MQTRARRDWPSLRRAWLLARLCVLAVAVVGSARAEPAASEDVAAVQAHVDKAVVLAGDDLKTPLFLCRADSGSVVRDALKTGSSQWIEPTRLFDNLFYIGNRFVGVFVVKTSAGLILFDSTTSPDDAENHLAPGLTALGLRPEDIRYVIVTHGHWDHFGGAAWLQKTYGARVGLSRADWDMIENEPADTLGADGHAIPKRDLVIRDGQTLVLGDTRIKLYLTPGHTPGTVSAIVPARENGKTYALSLLGSVAFPPNLQATATNGGLLKYDASVRRFAAISRRAGAVGILNTHVFADGGLDRLAAAESRQTGQPNPYLIGAGATGRYYALLDECLQAAIGRAKSAGAPATGGW
ncbi:MAG: MBL fold metallo-hydrolase [Caulobacteraceae bacterium]|nr:MBL fold metallo-hydrolase [Caulobacteraceae bacterium]